MILSSSVVVELRGDGDFRRQNISVKAWRTMYTDLSYIGNCAKPSFVKEHVPTAFFIL